MRFVELVEASRSVRETDARLGKIGHLASVLKRLSPDEIEIGIAFLSGSPRQGRIGLGGAVVTGARAVVPAGSPTLELADVDAAFDRIAGTSGPGSSVGSFLIRSSIGSILRAWASSSMADSTARRPGASPGARTSPPRGRSSGVSRCRVNRLGPA